MTFLKNGFVNFLILMVAFKEVATWTIDLPEVRKFLFEKNEKYKKYNKNEYEEYLDSDKKFYSNIEGNSKHNSEDYKHEHHPHEEDKYADEYGHHTSYMEKKVLNIVRDGSSYLEGLQRSLEEYSTFLESCNRRNSTVQNSSTSSNSSSWRPAYDPPSSSSSSSSSPSSSTSNSSPPMLNFGNYDNSTVPMRPNNSRGNGSRFNNMRSRTNRPYTCEEATESREQIRRYAALAMWATKRLQDLAYSKKYQKEDEQEENELILKLAWFLDRLAYLSGYEPDYKDQEPRGTPRPTTTSPTPPTLVPSSAEMTQEMMDCLKRNSSEPATTRCQYTGQIPDLMRQMMAGKIAILIDGDPT
ncbi:hypothetical protein PYW08_012854 [Mythimna loreyi]|uniref:Uncharacterized protein n=1 Tax=Mythimna loreyi TaxID=667449 RepID=A0ACC2Q1X0_9NEOP|nr:hypothetical protein PYW08_012854 [Mythimna loreyi]